MATITLNRPERLNALTLGVYEELRDTFRALDREPDVRAVVITGAGKGFCSGGDVREIIGARVGARVPGAAHAYAAHLFGRRRDAPMPPACRRCAQRHGGRRRKGDRCRVQASLMTHADFREAYEAFIGTRPPRFR